MSDDTRPTIPFPPRPLRSPADAAMAAIGDLITQPGYTHSAAAVDPETEPPHRRARTEIEQAAFWLNHLRYLDLKKTCMEITGSEDEAKKLADQVAIWAETKVALALKEGAPQ